MYKVLLVDDEALIREAISENTKWNELGYELVGACKNGKEAIEKIKENPPDLLLTDICMPYVDGMDLTQFVYENYRDTKVVIISGYDEFEYAKKAVKYQVVEYILKPITAMELSDTLKKVREKLDDEHLQSQNMQKIKGAYISNLPLLRGRFLNSLLSGNVQMDNIREKLVDYNIHLTGNRFMTAMVLGDDFTSFLHQDKDIKPDLAYFAIYNISDEIMSHYELGVTFQDVDERTILVFGGEPGLEKRALQVCEEIQQAILKFLKIECTIAVGQVVDSVEKLHNSFADTKKALEYKFLLGGNQIIYAANLRGAGMRAGVDVAGYAGQVILDIKTGDEDAISSHIQAFIQAIRDAYVSRNRSIFYIQNAVLSIMNGLDTSAMNESWIFTEQRELLNTIYNKEQLADISEDLISFCVNIARNMKDQKDSYCKKQAIMALDYIDKNYGNADITLNTVCSYLAMSTSYFSSIFKAYTGETFIEALTKKRIERARLLLENTSKKAYEIADEVGYADPHYFSSIFKKMTGMTPTEYAKKMRQV